MNPRKLVMMATVSAVALGMAFHADSALAAAFDLDDDIAVIDADAAVDNTVDLTITNNLNFQNIGVTSHATDTASLVMSAAGAITDDLGPGVGTEAHIISDDGTGQQAVITIANAFASADLFTYYSNLVNLSDGSAPDLVLAVVQDDLATAGSFTATGAVQVVGREQTTAGGGLVINIGATLTTQATASPYNTGAYDGAFDLVVSY